MKKHRKKKHKHKRKPYIKRSDPQKLKTNWERTLSLMQSRHFSSAVVRAATCAEIATNIVIRRELVDDRRLDKEFVDNLLVWANGIHGKFVRILIPLFRDSPRKVEYEAILSEVKAINKARNDVVHSGYVSDKKPAEDLIRQARDICLRIVQPYLPEFSLDEYPES